MLTLDEMLKLLRWVGADRRRLATILQRERLIKSIVRNEMRRNGEKPL
ncbi:hypothetical protein LCGC14_1576370 [marine sediment metagenome]|uniref:Uncharacterized protein n=1 Tax=marine sediment metagenome TaxID=412755 RepID=A0A0F9IIA6_9ZZZZ